MTNQKSGSGVMSGLRLMTTEDFSKMSLDERFAIQKEHRELDRELQKTAYSDLNFHFISSKVDADRAKDDIQKASKEFWCLMQHIVGANLPEWFTVEWCETNYRNRL